MLFVKALMYASIIFVLCACRHDLLVYEAKMSDPFLTMDQAMEMAVAFTESIDITMEDYEINMVCFRPYRANWIISFNNASSKWADYFSVIIDDQSQEIRVIRGR